LVTLHPGGAAENVGKGAGDARLHGCGAILVAQIHSTQRLYRAVARRAFQPCQGGSAWLCSFILEIE
jgi:hypothetical protein